MLDIYLVILVLLFVLAISDLIVGVSNDAVNFLNSAIGSKVATRRTIMIVASLGILVGATFSSGMMEVARKGIFNPEYFYFAEIMTIFMAVMITDIILLDLFNTFGMPTSTTVSIVFELLGAAVAVSLLKILSEGENAGTLGDYINSSSAILIISGIFISVLIAFVIGALVQYISRILFTFNIQKKLKVVGSVWSGLALSALTYFLLIKGVKGASFVSGTFISWVQENTLVLLTVSFVFWSIVMYLLYVVLKVNILRIVVLFGTFALAMAFAGNDLVNFIGVPIAGFESYQNWVASGEEPTSLVMSFLNEPIRTDTYMLVIAGGIMIVTLWFSKKARSVTETEVNLGRQDEGSERFKPNLLAKGIVRYSIAIGNSVDRLVPVSWSNRIARSFKPVAVMASDKTHRDKPAFDLLRASVNLTVASILIALATSFKLPLSTTYVSFMVAMGTSLADKAWSRSSAVFRVSGVINVIGGWFFTAIVAFSASAVFALCIFYFGFTAIVLLMMLAVFLITRTFMMHRKKEKVKSRTKALESETSALGSSQIISETKQKVGEMLELVRKVYVSSLTGLIQEDPARLKRAKEKTKELLLENELMQKRLYGLIKRIAPEHKDAGRLYLLIYHHEQDFLQSISLIVKSCRTHVSNSMTPVNGRHSGVILEMSKEVDEYLKYLSDLIVSGDFKGVETALNTKRALLHWLEDRLDAQMDGIQAGEFGMRQSLLLFTIFLETKDLVAVAARFAKLYNRIQKSSEGK
ncbi:inorganic phosphate transporter [Aureitalea sp. L0-47]|uniref:inorganic phosphate transporter n=1 Tax=Aureitalea sp. L0-47 TaxID=2816962 RepID=UPI002237265C|nr:inorganic phosphate transporter [Aureitalea sp. L0-47]MCW5520078.1 inorganic phosphate transporter [Aureitalea sp. L0-47]